MRLMTSMKRLFNVLVFGAFVLCATAQVSTQAANRAATPQELVKGLQDQIKAIETRLRGAPQVRHNRRLAGKRPGR